MKHIFLNHPTRGRSDKIFETFKNFVDNSSKKNYITHWFSIDSDDPHLSLYYNSVKQCKEYGIDKNVTVVLHEENNITVVEAASRAYTQDILNSYDILACISDDFRMPENWDNLIIEQFDLYGYNKILKTTQPNARQDLIAIQIAGHQFWKDYGSFFYHEYPSMYADDDMTGWAYLNDRVIQAPHIICKHLYPGYLPESFIWDETYTRENQQHFHDVGKQIFERRKSNGFK
jgi:hypothetical protein